MAFNKPESVTVEGPRSFLPAAPLFGTASDLLSSLPEVSEVRLMALLMDITQSLSRISSFLPALHSSTYMSSIRIIEPGGQFRKHFESLLLSMLLVSPPCI